MLVWSRTSEESTWSSATTLHDFRRAARLVYLESPLLQRLPELSQLITSICSLRPFVNRIPSVALTLLGLSPFFLAFSMAVSTLTGSRTMGLLPVPATVSDAADVC